MQGFPHHYKVAAAATPDGDVSVTAAGVPAIASAPPVQFDGPGDRWSPEDLLVAAVADCFVLSFKAIARASKLDWTALECTAEGTLDRVDRVTRFTRFDVSADLRVPAGIDEARAQRILEKSEAACLITNSLTAEAHLTTRIRVGAG